MNKARPTQPVVKPSLVQQAYASILIGFMSSTHSQTKFLNEPNKLKAWLTGDRQGSR